MKQDEMQQINERVKIESVFVEQIKEQMSRVIVGQDYLVDRLLIGLLSNGHVLLEGVPGLAKTLSVSTLAQTIDAKFSRLQFTPDLLPSDLIGTQIYDAKNASFMVKKGPIFANLVLADEINRAPAKVQSALLEAMQEKQVTIGDETFKLDAPFLVLATQNPIEQEGTYALPEAQIDRFMLKLKVTYPTKREEQLILRRMAKINREDTVQSVVTLKQIMDARRLVDQIYIDEKLQDYIVDLVIASRDPEAYKIDIASYVEFGASPRATIALTLASKAHAFLRGRGYVTPQDIKSIGVDVLRHRVIPTYEAEADEIDSDELVKRIFDAIVVP